MERPGRRRFPPPTVPGTATDRVDEARDTQSDEELERLAESRSLADELGVPLVFASDEFAPPVDRARLRAFVRRELPADLVEETCHLIAAFQSWHQAWGEALAEEAAHPE